MYLSGKYLSEYLSNERNYIDIVKYERLLFASSIVLSS